MKQKKKTKPDVPAQAPTGWAFNLGLSSGMTTRELSKVSIPLFMDSRYYHDNRCWAPVEWYQQAIQQTEFKVASVAATVIPSGVSFGKNANQGVVSQYSLDLIAEIMIASGNSNLTITSTLRTAEDQARAMYQNIKNKGFQFNYDLYGKNGDMVVKVAEEAAKKKLSDKEIMEAMTKEINRIGPGKISNHAGDPNKINVIDISPGSLSDRDAFEQEVEKRIVQWKIKFLKPPADPAYHLEISQPLQVQPLP